MPPREPINQAYRRLTTVVILIGIALIGLAFAAKVIVIWECPLLLPLDGGQYAFNAYYFGQHFEPLPLPHLELISDDSMYPVGTDHVFLHWAFEREIVLWVLGSVLGSGPWLQVYFLVSMLITAVGSLLILKREFSMNRATIAAVAVSFCNFYAIRKFPIHIPHSCVHWTTIGVLLDFIIVRRVSAGRTVSARLLFLRVTVLMLSLGLELGYVAGLSLASFVLTTIWCLAVVAARAGFSPFKVRDLFRRVWIDLRRTFVRHPRQNAVLLLAAIVLAWLYVPLCAQIVTHANHFDFSDVGLRAQSESPVRILMPYLPGFNPVSHANLFKDHGEAWGLHFSPGLAFVFAAVLGLLCGGPKSYRSTAPFLVLFLVCVFYDPSRLPTLKVLPWFAHAQVPGRLTSVFPVLLTTFALSLPDYQDLRRLCRVVIIVVGAIFVVEAVVAYGIITDKATRPSIRQVTCPGEELWHAMATIRSTPGEAIFEWPYSIAHDSGRLGSYQKTVGVLNQLAPYHRKKQVSAYFGRLHPSTLEPFQTAGWPELFNPQREGGQRLRLRQSRDLLDSEWILIDDFLTENDFCGILLFTDLLPEDTVVAFHRRYGESVVDFVLDLNQGNPGRVEFIAIQPDRGGALDDTTH